MKFVCEPAIESTVPKTSYCQCYIKWVKKEMQHVYFLKTLAFKLNFNYNFSYRQEQHITDILYTTGIFFQIVHALIFSLFCNRPGKKY